MDLNKDNRDIYTIDSESYSEYMQDNLTERRDLLGSFIKFLLLILLLVLSYFFYNILKYDLSFSEVFNKKELLSTYELFNKNYENIYVKKEDYVEVLAKNISTDLVEPTKTVALVVSENDDEPIVEKVKKEELKEEVTVTAEVVTKELEIVETVDSVKIIEEVIVADLSITPKVEISEPLIVESIKEIEEAVEVEEETIVKSVPVEILTDNDVSSETKLSENYLDRMVAELNSI